MSARNTSDGGVADTPLDALLADYVNGTLSPSLTVLVAAHLELRPDSRAYVASLASAAGQWLDSVDPVPIARSTAMLKAILDSDDTPFDSAPATPLPADACDPAIPAALRRHIDAQSPRPQWRWLLPGVRRLQVSRGESDQAFLLHGRPGRALPTHVHNGTEIALVLSGSYADAGGRYIRGDIAICEGGSEHRPVIDEGEDCLCLIVLDGPIRLSGPVGRVIDWVTRGSVGRLIGG